MFEWNNRTWEGCSLPAPNSKEVYGQKKTVEFVWKIVKQKKEESWRVMKLRIVVVCLLQNREKWAYIQPDTKWQNIDLSQFNNIKPLGILKNWHCPELKAVKYGKEHFTLSNTSAADSLIQLIVTATVDSESFRNFDVNKQKNSALLELAYMVVYGSNKRNFK